MINILLPLISPVHDRLIVYFPAQQTISVGQCWFRYFSAMSFFHTYKVSPVLLWKKSSQVNSKKALIVQFIASLHRHYRPINPSLPKRYISLLYKVYYHILIVSFLISYKEDSDNQCLQGIWLSYKEKQPWRQEVIRRTIINTSLHHRKLIFYPLFFIFTMDCHGDQYVFGRDISRWKYKCKIHYERASWASDSRFNNRPHRIMIMGISIIHFGLFQLSK